MIMTGRLMFEMWVANGLCSDREYRWEQLSENRQKQWNALARTLAERLKGAQ